MAAVTFFKHSFNPKDHQGAVEALSHWEGLFYKKIGKLKNPLTKEAQNLCTAHSITQQAVLSIKEGKGHAFVWGAMKVEKISAILVADECKGEIIIRFLVANLADPDAKGSGTFLVENVVALATKTNKLIRTTPQNAEKFWRNKMGFQADPKNPIEYVYQPIAGDIVAPSKNEKGPKQKKRN